VSSERNDPANMSEETFRYYEQLATEKENKQILTERGPVYGVLLIDTLPIGSGMLQQMPSRYDLEMCRKRSERVVAGYEVLLSHYLEAVEKLKARDGGAK